jgi:predicted RNase H-like HicB family nuclease
MASMTAYVEWDEESRLFIGIVAGITGAHTQGATLEELEANLREVLALCVEEQHLTLADIPKFVGLQQVEVAV